MDRCSQMSNGSKLPPAQQKHSAAQPVRCQTKLTERHQHICWSPKYICNLFFFFGHRKHRDQHGPAPRSRGTAPAAVHVDGRDMLVHFPVTAQNLKAAKQMQQQLPSFAQLSADQPPAQWLSPFDSPQCYGNCALVCRSASRWRLLSRSLWCPWTIVR
jgi:hypothetical protein